MAASKNQTPSITTIMSIPDGKILDFLTKRFVRVGFTQLCESNPAFLSSLFWISQKSPPV